MATFTQEIKKDLVSRIPDNACCRIAMGAALLRTCGSIVSGREGIGFEFASENEYVAEYFNRMIENTYGVCLEFKGAAPDIRRVRDVITFSCYGREAERILEDADIILRDREGVLLNMGIGEEIVANECCAEAFLKGAFLGGGSCTLPAGGSKTGYHLEFVFSSPVVAEGVLSLLSRFDLIGKYVKRGEKHIVYFQVREVLSDFFALIDARVALKKLDRISAERMENNLENRINNCFVGNMDKTASASAEQCVAIGRFKEESGFDRLEAPLRELAEARLAYPMDSLRSLAERLGVTKSCVGHRMRKLMEIANRS